MGGIYIGTKLAEEAGSKDKQWEYWCGSRAAITQCGKKYATTSDIMAPEADVILAIRHNLKQGGKDGIFKHVKGHQNENRRFSELDRETKYNVLCDEYATQAAKGRDETELPYLGSKEMISIRGEWINSNIEQRVTDALTGQK